MLHLYGTHITSGKLTNLKRYRDERHDLPPIITHNRQPGSVTQMVSQLGWEPLQVRRVKIRLLLLFKIQHNQVAIPAEAYLLPSDSRTRGQNTFRIPSTRKDIYRNSFFPRSIRQWNNLPSAATTASSVEEFRDTLGNLPPAQFLTV